MVDFSQSSGMRPQLTCMQPRTLAAWLSGYKQFCLTTDENGCLAVLHNRNHMVTTFGKIRRLHLLVVDLERTKSVSDQVYWQYQKVKVSTDHTECFNTLPVPIADAESPVRCRYVCGYGVDGSDRPSYLLWPRRGSDGRFWLMDPRSGEFFDPAKATFIAQLGLKHFFDAFALEHKRDVRVDAARALELDDEDILPTLVVKQEVAQQFKLTPVPLPVDPPAKRAKKMKDEESLNDTAVFLVFLVFAVLFWFWFGVHLSHS